jgi:type III secretory pathway component EscV
MLPASAEILAKSFLQAYKTSVQINATPRHVRYSTIMKKHFALLFAFFAIVSSSWAASYSTEVTMTPQKEKDTYEVNVNITELVEQGGKATEKSLGQPKLKSPFGSPASMYVGPDAASENYQKEDNVTVDVTWPKAGETGVAICTVTIKHGDKVVSKSRMRFAIEAR